MKKRHLFGKLILITVILLLGILFVAKFGGPSLLRMYIENGVGSCEKIPILCKGPESKIINPQINKEYIGGLLPYKFPNMSIDIPKGFTVVQERIKKVYYKKGKHKYAASVIYLLYTEPKFFINLYPQLTKQVTTDNYEFIKRTMFARLTDIKNLTDTFFVIMKSIFIPDLGDQKNVKMAQFVISDKRGFINYNLAYPDNYFDCNIIDKDGNFFKIYIKDKGARLDMDKVLAIISTVTKPK